MQLILAAFGVDELLMAVVEETFTSVVHSNLWFKRVPGSNLKERLTKIYRFSFK